jgi:hypothetical protein
MDHESKTIVGTHNNPTTANPPNPIRRRTNSWEKKNAIVYDVSSQTLTKEKRANVEGKSTSATREPSDDCPVHHTRIEIPTRPKISLRKDNVRISVPVCPASGPRFLAEIKLSSLGYKVAFERLCGNIDEIWIKGIPHAVY